MLEGLLKEFGRVIVEASLQNEIGLLQDQTRATNRIFIYYNNAPSIQLMNDLIVMTTETSEKAFGIGPRAIASFTIVMSLHLAMLQEAVSVAEQAGNPAPTGERKSVAFAAEQAIVYAEDIRKRLMIWSNRRFSNLIYLTSSPAIAVGDAYGYKFNGQTYQKDPSTGAFMSEERAAEVRKKHMESERVRPYIEMIRHVRS